MNSPKLANLSKIGQLKVEAPDANERAGCCVRLWNACRMRAFLNCRW